MCLHEQIIFIFCLIFQTKICIQYLHEKTTLIIAVAQKEFLNLPPQATFSQIIMHILRCIGWKITSSIGFAVFHVDLTAVTQVSVQVDTVFLYATASVSATLCPAGFTVCAVWSLTFGRLDVCYRYPSSPIFNTLLIGPYIINTLIKMPNIERSTHIATYIKQIAHRRLISISIDGVNLDAVREIVLTVDGKSRSSVTMKSTK